MARTKNAKVPEVGSEAPEINLPSAQGGSLRLGMRTATGPVIVAFFRGVWSEEDVSFFKKLAEKEDEINLAIGNVVGVGMVESAAAREFAKASGMKSYILYDYAKTATPAWGLLEKDKENGEYARPATFLIDSDNKVVEAWIDDRPNPNDLLAKVSEITGLPKAPEEEGGDEKPKKAKAAKKADAEGEKPSPEEREKRRAEREAARESGGDAKPAAESGEEKTKAEAKSGGEAGNEEESEGASSEGAEEKSEVKSGGGAGKEAGGGGSGEQAEGASSEGSERGGAESGDGSDEEGGEARSGKKEGKEGG